MFSSLWTVRLVDQAAVQSLREKMKRSPITSKKTQTKAIKTSACGLFSHLMIWVGLLTKLLTFSEFQALYIWWEKSIFLIILWYDIPQLFCHWINQNLSRTSNIAFLMDSAETVVLDFGLIHQNISFKKASFHY